MPEVFAVVGSFLSVAAALVSFFVSLNVRKRTLELKRVLSSKYQDLPLSPDVEDPDERDR
jgi:hypothetical protein